MKRIKLSLRQIAEILYTKFGVNIVGYKNRSKEPIGKWKDFQNIRQAIHEAFNFVWGTLTGIGIILGKIGNIHVIDVDYVESDEEVYKVLELLGLPKDYSWLVRSGSGKGFHIYFHSENLSGAFPVSVVVIPAPSNIQCKQIEIRISGLIVAPGSLHESGNYYEFVNPNEYDKPMEFLSPERIKEAAKKLGYVVKEKLPTEQAFPAIKQVDSSSLDSIYDCINQLDKGNALSHYYSEWSKVGLAFANSLGEAGRNPFHVFSQLSSKYKKEDCDLAYSSFLKAPKKGRPVTIGTFYYLCKQLGVTINKNSKKKSDDESRDEHVETINFINSHYNIFRDTLTDTVYIDGVPFDDFALNNIYIKLIVDFKFRYITKDYILSVSDSKYIKEIHRILDLVVGYIPQNETGNIKKLCDTLITETGKEFEMAYRGEKRSYVSVVLELYLVKMMQQFFEPKANDLCIVLLGDMHIGKTYWLMNVLPKELLDLCRISQFTNDKDFKVQLSESALLVIDEIKERDMSSNEFMKLTMTNAQFSLRVPYARKPKLKRRIASLAGTGNNMFILRDPSGNRRFVPLWLENIDKELFNSINKMDLFYEVYQLYKSGYDTTLTSELLHAISTTSKDFEVRTEVDEVLLKHCPPLPPKHPNAVLLSVSEICKILKDRTERVFNVTQVGYGVDRLGYEGKTTKTVTYNGKISTLWKYYCDPTGLADSTKLGFDTLPTLPEGNPQGI